MRVIDFILEIACPDEQMEEIVLAYLSLTASTGSFSAGKVLRAYFSSPSDRDAAAKTLAAFPVQLRNMEAERTDWLAAYQQSLKPIFIGESFLVAPDAKLIPGDAKRLPLVIPQEQAFGTGSHESTALCIELLESIDLRGKRGLDVGAGSGILALAMRRLGAKKVIAFDNDLDAYGALRENAMRNAIDLALFIGTVDALRGGTFDVITMNILPEVIIPTLPQVRKHLRGSLIVSGILTSRRDDVVKAARGLRVVNERSKGEWWAGILSI